MYKYYKFKVPTSKAQLRNKRRLVNNDKASQNFPCQESRRGSMGWLEEDGKLYICIKTPCTIVIFQRKPAKPFMGGACDDVTILHMSRVDWLT